MGRKVLKKRKLLYWVTGCVVVLIGIGVVRLPHGLFFESYRLPLLIIGTVIAFVGLWIITKGTGAHCNSNRE